jgi:hypothetical protein
MKIAVEIIKVDFRVLLLFEDDTIYMFRVGLRIALK